MIGCHIPNCLSPCCNDLLGKINHICKRLDSLEAQLKCQTCHGIGKVIGVDLSSNSQGEDDRWTAINCPACEGKKFVNI